MGGKRLCASPRSDALSVLDGLVAEEHPPGPFPHDLIQARGQVLPSEVGDTSLPNAALLVALVSTNALMNELVDGGGGGGGGAGGGAGFPALALGAAKAGDAAGVAASNAAAASNVSVRVLRTGEPPVRVPGRPGRVKVMT